MGSLRPPDEKAVLAILVRVVKQLAKDFEGLEAGWPEDGLEVFQAQAVQHRLSLGQAEEATGQTGRRLAVLEGFRLHADTHVHAHDRKGLERLCRYGSRGPVVEERLSLRDDGRYEYRTKRGPTLLLTAAQLVKRLIALIPPQRTHLTLFHGMFASKTQGRAQAMRAPAESSTAKSELVQQLPRTPQPEGRPPRPRLDWASSFTSSKLTCPATSSLTKSCI